VFRVRHRASGDVFAVKRSRRRFRSKLQRERCLREIRAVAALPAHPNIVNQYRAWQVRCSRCALGQLRQPLATWVHHQLMPVPHCPACRESVFHSS